VQMSHIPPSRGGVTSIRTSGSLGVTGDPTSGLYIPEADVVQLTQSHDGIWRVPASPTSDTSFTRTTPRRTWQPQRLSPSVGQRYASTGRLQASPPTPGLMIDLYV
jgi:hypothetical protein